jgi:hypothetical protein
VSVLSYAQAPVPFVNQPLVPDATPPGGAQFTLTVNGTGFVSSSVVNWNGNALVTQFVSGSQLTATVPAEDIATASTASVTVVNPAPGGGPSNVVFFTPTTDRGKSAKFILARSPGVYFPQAVAAGDFNGDGKLDLAVASPGSPSGIATSKILLGDGTGNFTLASTPGAGLYPNSIAVGDFNRDGKLDLAFTDWSFNTAPILLGDGTGNFTLASSLSAYYPSSVAVGYFNGDGKLDLAFTNNYYQTVSILLGDGTGNFSLASSQDVGLYPSSIAVGDFNGDGKLDLATANNGDNTVSILLGKGTGSFILASSPAVNSSPNSVTVGDFNGDGKLDLATANGGGSVSILLGNGTGNFYLASSPRVGSIPSSVVAGDFNGDGKLDLAVANEGSNTVSILLGIPSGPYLAYYPNSLTFGPQLYGTSSAPQPVTLTSSGTEMIDITQVIASANFSQTNNCPRHLNPGRQCTANVIFTPRNVNTITGTVTITDNVPTARKRSR